MTPSNPSGRQPDRRRAGFTLFEVGISLVLVTFGVVTVLTLLPVGLKSQQLARFQLYASTKAEEMVECFNNTHNANPAIDVEAMNPWDVPVNYRSQNWDLESRLATHRFGILPLPMDIARRLDSDGDEIQAILGEGGYLYYSQPMATTNLEEQAMSAAPNNEAQKLVFTVSGYAQNNAIPIFPWKAWPYVMPYPSPPLHGLHYRDAEFLTPGTVRFDFDGKPCISWEGTTQTAGTSTPGADDDIKLVFEAFKKYAYDNTPTQDNAIEYLQAALLYCQRKALTNTFYDPNPIPAPVPAFEPGTLDADGKDSMHVAWKQVQAMRFLAHAAMTMTRWRSLAELGGQPSTVGSGTPIPSRNGSPTINLTHDLITYYHDRCMKLIMLYAASFPYDWGAPRPLQRVIMTDYPLIEYDLFSPPRPGKIWEPGGGTIDACQWKPVAAQPIHNIGLSYQFPVFPIPDGSDSAGVRDAFWGNQRHNTLTRKFSPAERCREIVFWAVDWQAYEDCETAPGAPVDASKYPFRAPRTGENFAARMNNAEFRDEQLYCYRNPEKALTFRRDMSGVATGTLVEADIGLNRMGDQWDRGTGSNQRHGFSAMWGADRNFNKKLDRGNVPRSVRMRAKLVARFNFYDPRLVAIVR